jgi:heme exporter protein A
MELQAEALTCSRGGREVFRNVSFKVPAGEALIVTGRNGAGKSSLLRMIAGLVRIAAGRLSLNGGPAGTPIGEQAHYLSHQDAMKPSLTVAENLHFWTRFLGSRNDITPALELLDLAPLADLPAGYLSAGQRRRLSVARIVSVSRPVWLLDEPTSRSMHRRRAGSRTSCAATSQVAESLSPPRTDLSVLSARASSSLVRHEPARRNFATRYAPRGSRRRRGLYGRAFLFDRDHNDAVCRRT